MHDSTEKVRNLIRRVISDHTIEFLNSKPLETSCCKWLVKHLSLPRYFPIERVISIIFVMCLVELQRVNELVLVLLLKKYRAGE